MKKRPIKLITLDTETYNGLIGGLKRIAIYDGENVIYGYTFNDIEPYLIKYHKAGYNVHIYIHNLEFDARKIPEIFDKKRIVWEKCFIINNKLATVSCKKYTIHDSFKILPMSLKRLSEDFDVEHGKLDLWEEVEKTYPHTYKDIVDYLDICDKDDPLYLKYLGYDVKSLYEILEKIIEVAGLELSDFVKKISTASLSRHIFKKGYKGKEFKNPFGSKSDYEILCQFNYKDHLEIEEFLRDSYCGGRTEVFKIEMNKKGYHYDVNSLYPFVMLGEFPVGKPIYKKTSKLAKYYFETWQDTRQGIGFLYCDVFIPDQNIPPLPLKMGKLAFACGHVYGVWNFEELQYAIENCGVVIEKYREVVFYENTYPVFERFINTMIEIKNEGTRTGNLALRTLGKLLMNVGYGYTGMRRDDKTSLASIDDYEKYEDIRFIDAELGFIEIPTEIKSEYIQVAVASTVTARARLILLDALRYADANGIVYYCDTDSVVTDVKLPDTMVDSVELGKWDLEGEPLKALFLKPKVYVELFENKKDNVKFKGVTKDTQQGLDFFDYERLLKDLQENKKEYVIVEKNKTTLRSVMYMKKNNINMDYYETRDKKFNLGTKEKRQMDYLNNDTKPYFFDSKKEFNEFTFSKYPKRVQYDMSGGGKQ